MPYVESELPDLFTHEYGTIAACDAFAYMQSVLGAYIYETEDGICVHYGFNYRDEHYNEIINAKAFHRLISRVRYEYMLYIKRHIRLLKKWYALRVFLQKKAAKCAFSHKDFRKLIDLLRSLDAGIRKSDICCLQVSRSVTGAWLVTAQSRRVAASGSAMTLPEAFKSLREQLYLNVLAAEVQTAKELTQWKRVYRRLGVAVAL